MVSLRNEFDTALYDASAPLERAKPEILQLNVGKLCNLTCVHCHVNAGPARKEIVSGETVDLTADFPADDALWAAVAEALGGVTGNSIRT